MSSLGAYLERRYARFGDELNLAEALRCFRQAIATTVSDADKAGFVANLAGALTTSVRRTGWLPEITTAVTTARQALQLRAGPITELNALTALSNALGLRADFTGSTDDRAKRKHCSPPSGDPARALP
ncbi:hypothetical protein B0I32_13214 [Nonomuraea fuscirosea]|uniref:Uncharacterized protein n=1 Tax=Nonomuraea fuscirosea TaxID=1291556 RepID=A0A2T0M4W6_9ACTN|nr:hypothetical protein [Nonomuraea fuscirosea]PRX52264.1 hypothetical protein B0I32_13214 [Nonomuraea fuscirosea]